MTKWIYRLALAQALWRGVRAGLKPAPPLTAAAVSDMIKRLYCEPIRLQLAAQPPWDWPS